MSGPNNNDGIESIFFLARNDGKYPTKFIVELKYDTTYWQIREPVCINGQTD